MPTDVRFAFVCQKKWSELIGDDPVTRYCDVCRRDIVNLDPLSEAERDTLFRNAVRSGDKLCVFVTTPNDNANRCQDDDLLEDIMPDEGMVTGGEPLLDDYDSPDVVDLDDDDDIKIEL